MYKRENERQMKVIAGIGRINGFEAKGRLEILIKIGINICDVASMTVFVTLRLIDLT